MFRTIKKMRLVVCILCGASLPLALHADDTQPQQDPDWPCDQILVPEIPSAVVWAGPPITGMEDAWERDDAVKSLVLRLVSPDYDMDSADGVIDGFSAKQDPAQKDHKLILLFAGVIQSLNEKREKELGGIIRYARGQAERANRLSEDLDELVRLQDDPSQAAQDRLALMQKEMELKQRMFDERESFIQHLCMRPVVIEQKLGVLARTIAYYLGPIE